MSPKCHLRKHLGIVWMKGSSYKIHLMSHTGVCELCHRPWCTSPNVMGRRLKYSSKYQCADQETFAPAACPLKDLKELSLGTNLINNNDCLRFGQLLWPSSGRNVGNHCCLSSWYPEKAHLTCKSQLRSSLSCHVYMGYPHPASSNVATVSGGHFTIHTFHSLWCHNVVVL